MGLKKTLEQSGMVSMYHFVTSPRYVNHNIFSGPVPYDGVPDKTTISVHPALTAVFVVLACAGIALAIVCIAFNFMYRKSRY